MNRMFGKTLVIIVTTLVLAACGTETKTKTVEVEKIINTETIVEVEKTPMQVSLALFAGELKITDNDCTNSVIDDTLSDLCLYGLRVTLRNILDIDQDTTIIDNELDGNVLNFELYDGLYIANVRGYHYINNESVHFTSSFLIPTDTKEFKQDVYLTPFVNDYIVSSDSLDQLLSGNQWLLSDVFNTQKLYIGQQYYQAGFVEYGSTQTSFNVFSLENIELASVTVKASHNVELEISINNSRVRGNISQNEEYEFFISENVFGTDWINVHLHEIYGEATDLKLEVTSMSDSQGNVYEVNHVLDAQYFEKGKIVSSNFENEQRFNFIGEGVELTEVCGTADTMPKVLNIDNFSVSENIVRNGETYCFTNLDFNIYSGGFTFSTDNNMVVTSIKGVGLKTQQDVTWEKSTD